MIRQSLTGAECPGAFFCMVDDRDGDGMAPLHLAQEGEQGRDFTADILIDAMLTHERIEHEEPWLQPGDGIGETLAVGFEIEAQAGCGDHLNVEGGEFGSGGRTDAFEAPADDVKRVLGGIEQDAAGAGHGEAAQTGDARGDGDGQIEGEERFAAFGFPADDADGFFRPQSLDEPAVLLGAIGEVVGWLDRKRGHRRWRAVALVVFGVGMAKVSKNSVSSI